MFHRSQKAKKQGFNVLQTLKAKRRWISFFAICKKLKQWKIYFLQTVKKFKKQTFYVLQTSKSQKQRFIICKL